MHSKVSSDWLPSYIKAILLVLEMFKMADYFPDWPHTLFTGTGKPLSYAADSIVSVHRVRYSNESSNIGVVPQSPMPFTCESTPGFSCGT
jgi:hypothetical protein